jgi:hypothetical protein
MIYRGPVFLDVVGFGTSPALSFNPVSKLQRRHAERLRQREEGGGSKSSDAEKFWSSINISKLFG